VVERTVVRRKTDLRQGIAHHARIVSPGEVVVAEIEETDASSEQRRRRSSLPAPANPKSSRHARSGFYPPNQEVVRIHGFAHRDPVLEMLRVQAFPKEAAQLKQLLVGHLREASTATAVGPWVSSVCFSAPPCAHGFLPFRRHVRTFPSKRGSAEPLRSIDGMIGIRPRRTSNGR